MAATEPSGFFPWAVDAVGGVGPPGGRAPGASQARCFAALFWVPLEEKILTGAMDLEFSLFTRIL